MKESQEQALTLAAGDRWQVIEKAINEYTRLRGFGLNDSNAVFKAILSVMSDLAEQMTITGTGENGTPKIVDDWVCEWCGIPACGKRTEDSLVCCPKRKQLVLGRVRRQNGGRDNASI